MKKRSIIPQRVQQGFIQAALLFGIALMTAILGGFALANRAPASQTDKEEAKVNASVILKQASDLRDGVQRFASDRGATSVNAGVDTTLGMDFSAKPESLGEEVGLFNLTDKYASPQIAPNSAFTTPPTVTQPGNATGAGEVIAGNWYLNKSFAANLDTTADVAVTTGPLIDEVCTQINKMLYGYTGTTPPAATGATAAFEGNTGITVTGSGAANAEGWSEGCITSATDGDNFYFKIVQEN